jgi:hypothetical protein
MAGNQDGLALPLAPRGTLVGTGMAVGAGVAGIQQLHGPQVDLTALQGQAHQFVDTQTVIQGGGHGGRPSAGGRRVKSGRRLRVIHLTAGGLNLGLEGVSAGSRTPCWIKATKRSGSKSTLVRVEKIASQVNLLTSAIVPTPTFPPPTWATWDSPLVRHGSEGPEGMPYLRFFPAYADFGAAFAFSRLLALKTKHGMPP